MKPALFSDLIGVTLAEVEIATDKQFARFVATNGREWLMQHFQDCCENVSIEDICGSLDDLIGSPILMAEEVTSEGKNPEGVLIPEYQDSFTWTFYKLATAKGYVTIRWYGESNGYYSESVSFDLVKEGRAQ